jgi:hypothetical protein
MIVIRWSPPSELDISAPPFELRAVRVHVLDVASGRAERAVVAADTAADAHPYARCLRSLAVSRGVGPARVAVDGETVTVTGSEDSLSAFASYFDFHDDAAVGRHNHFEHYADNKWIAADSIPLVISVG